MNIEHELYAIVDEIFIRTNLHFCNHCDMQCYIREINTFFYSVKDNEAVALYGLGQMAENLMKWIPQTQLSKIKWYSDVKAENMKMMFNGNAVVSPSELLVLEPDYVLICSHVYGCEINEYLIKRGFRKSSIRQFSHITSGYVMKPLSNNLCPHFIAQALYAVSVVPNDYVGYRFVSNAYSASQYSDVASLKEFALANLIFQDIQLRDFMCMEEHIKEYTTRFSSHKKQFEALQSKVEILFREIYQRIRKRKSKAMVIYLLDGMQSILVDHMPYLSQQRNQSYVFENAYTQYCWTTAAMQTIFSGKDLIADKTYNIYNFDENNSPLLNTVTNNQFCFSYLSTVRSNLFADKFLNAGGQETLLARQLWQSLVNLCHNDTNIICFAHVCERHDNTSPYGLIQATLSSNLFFGHDIYWQNVEMFRTIAYIDDEIRYYERFLNDDIVKIYMSDHADDFDSVSHFFGGDWKSKSSNRCETLLFVKAHFLCHHIEQRLFGYSNFHQLIEMLIKSKGFELIFSDFLNIYALPYYSPYMIELYKEKLPVPKLGLVIDEGIYWIDYNGNEEFYPTGSDKNSINEHRFESTIEDCRRLRGYDFNGLLEEPKFALAKNALIKLGKIGG